MKRTATSMAMLGAWVLGVGAWPASTATAADKVERVRAAAETLEKALRCAIQAEDARRKQLLKAALDQAPDYAPALWHNGHIRQRNRWVNADELTERSADDARLAAYREIRPRYDDTPPGQWELAAWCAKRNLIDQQRAHLTRVLDMTPDHEEARRLLGYRRVNGDWVSAEEITREETRAREMAVGMREWKPKLIKLRSDLSDHSQRIRDAAKERLLAIDDKAAIPALEEVFAREDERTVLLVVEVLAAIPAPEASQALARLAVLSESQPVCQAAIEHLKSRDLHSFVPMLLGAMGSPVQSRAQLYVAPGGRMVCRQMLIRKGQQQNEVAVFDTEYRPTLLRAENAKEAANARGMLAAARQADAMRKARAVQTAVTQQNALVAQFNKRIATVLSKITGEQLLSTAEGCWKWWNDYNEVFTEGDKPVKTDYRRETVGFEDPYKYVPAAPKLPTPRYRPPVTGPPPVDPTRLSRGSAPGSRMSRGLPGARYECLVAGTPVWTELGPVPIEQIVPGDRVFSQDPKTGCLDLKPVLKTTIRPSGPLVEIATHAEPIRASGGHPFWVAGEGWMKARQLFRGATLYGQSGTLTVRAVSLGAPETTYNLIVADFHTYFVGNARILSHDNTIRRPTSTIVPGLASQ